MGLTGIKSRNRTSRAYTRACTHICSRSFFFLHSFSLTAVNAYSSMRPRNVSWLGCSSSQRCTAKFCSPKQQKKSYNHIQLFNLKTSKSIGDLRVITPYNNMGVFNITTHTHTHNLPECLVSDKGIVSASL